MERDEEMVQVRVLSSRVVLGHVEGDVFEVTREQCDNLLKQGAVSVVDDEDRAVKSD